MILDFFDLFPVAGRAVAVRKLTGGLRGCSKPAVSGFGFLTFTAYGSHFVNLFVGDNLLPKRIGRYFVNFREIFYYERIY